MGTGSKQPVLFILCNKGQTGGGEETDGGLTQAAAVLESMRQEQLRKLPEETAASVTEIRLREGCLLAVTAGGKMLFLPGKTVGKAELEGLFLRLCQNAVYARKDEIAQGFLTAPGGHRVGLCGRAVTENGRVTGVKELTAVNLRVSRRHKGELDNLLPLFDTDPLPSVLLFGPPLSGKTTLLRELCCALAQRGRRVAVVDGREELAVPGVAMDVFRGYPREEGTEQAIRLFSPEILAFDELGDASDRKALYLAAQSGVALLTTAHAADPDSLRRRPLLRGAVTSGIFDRYVYLSGGGEPGRVRAILDGEGRVLERVPEKEGARA